MVMKKVFTLPLACLLTLSGIFSACDDENNVGSTITPGEVTIIVDSAFTVTGRSVRVESMDSRDGQLLIGRLYAEDYGELQAAFVGRLMPASKLAIPDSIPLEDISGMSLRFSFSSTGLTGDTLAPQELSVYSLTRQLPDDIISSFDPTGYYDSNNPMGSTSYTAAGLGATANKVTTGYVSVPLNTDFARQVVKRYRTDPSVFQWPETFAQYFPGIYVRSTFGRGLVLNFTNTEFLTFWNRREKVTKVINGISTVCDTLVADTTALFAISPEVLSANLLKLSPATSLIDRINAGLLVIQSPCGYNVEIDFPAQQILNRYNSDNFNLGVINTLSFQLPVTAPANKYDIAPPPYLLMVKSSKLADFFAQNKVPETNDKDAFWAAYNSEKGLYDFNNLRPYIVDLMKSGKPLTDDDIKFTLVPVNISTEVVGYGDSQRTVVTSCTPYLTHPSVCVINLTDAKVKFTYSRQVMR